MQTVGNFRGTVIDGAVGPTSGGFAQVVLKVHADEMFDEDNKEWGPWDEFTWEPNEIDDRDAIIYCCIFGSKGATFAVDEVKEIFGWNPEDGLANLDGLLAEGTKIQWSNAMDTYDGKTRCKSDGIKAYDAEPGGSLRKLDKKGLAEMDAKFGKFLKAEVKPEKAAKAKRRGRKAAEKPDAPVEEVKVEEPKADKPKRGARGGKKKAADTKPATKTSAPPAEPPEEVETVEEQADNLFSNSGPCTKAEAWADICERQGDGVTDGQVSDAWMKVIQDVGGGKKQKELSDDEWGSVRAAVIDVVDTF